MASPTNALTEQCTGVSMHPTHISFIYLFIFLVHKSFCIHQQDGHTSEPAIKTYEGKHPAAGPPAQERHGPIRVGPEGHKKNDQRAGWAPVL